MTPTAEAPEYTSEKKSLLCTAACVLQLVYCGDATFIYNLGVIFLVETDTNSVNIELDYKLPGFKTIVQNKKCETDPTRIICLVEEKLCQHTIIRQDHKKLPQYTSRSTSSVPGFLLSLWSPVDGTKFGWDLD